MLNQGVGWKQVLDHHAGLGCFFLEVDSKGGGDGTQATYMTTIKNVITIRKLLELMGTGVGVYIYSNPKSLCRRFTILLN